MIKQKFYELFAQYYNTPKQKALVDMLGLFLGIILGSVIVVIVAHFGFWLEMAILMMAYGITSLIKVIYDAKVAHYEFQEKYGKQ